MEISTPAQAFDAAQRFLDRENFGCFGYMPAVNAEYVEAAPNGFTVPWNTEAYWRTCDIREPPASSTLALACVDETSGVSAGRGELRLDAAVCRRWCHSLVSAGCVGRCQVD